VTERLIARKEGALGWIVFNNPERRNAMSIDMWQALPSHLDDFEKDPAIRVVVLAGAGDKAFVSGADISQFEKQRSSREQVQHYEDISEAALARLSGCERPVLAMIRGYCLGAGVNIANGCDLRIAAEDARFGIPAGRMGLGYRATSMQSLVNVVGAPFAREIMLTARHFTAAEALHMGLVHRVVPAAELESFTRKYCEDIAANAPLTLRAAKRTIREVSKREYDVELCRSWVRECFESEDYAEGRRAFMEKRKPQFRGR
jgi:enoyl-CoA hydratase/carnithine racemase